MTHNTTTHQSNAQTYTRTRKSPAQIEDGRMQQQAEMTEIVAAVMLKLAPDIAAEALRRLEEQYGGGRGPLRLYAPDKTERNAKIRATFDGTNAAEVCRTFGVSRSRLYEIVGQRTAPKVRFSD